MLVKSIWLILISLYLYQFILIYKYSVDIPFKDDWLYLKPGFPLCLPEHFNLKWLFAKVTEHNIVITNLMTWVNFKLFGIDYIKQKIVNYMIFGILLLAILHFKNRIIGSGNFRTFPAFLIFLLSPIAVENHSWAFQSQIHLVLLFFVLMLTYMSGKLLSAGETVKFLLVSILAIYSFAAGVILALTCLFFRNLQVLSLIVSGNSGRRNGLQNVATCTLIIGGAVALWYSGNENPAFLPQKIWPDDPLFWEYFLNMLSFGFGVDSQNLIAGIFFLLLATLPLLLFSVDREKRLDPAVLSISAAIFAVLTALLAITIGRAGFGYGYAKTSRYVEITFMLVPFTAMAWWLLLKNPVVRHLLVSFLWAVCFIGYLDNWTPSQYIEAYNDDKATLDCVTNYYRLGGDVQCQEYITPAHYENARKLGIHFTRQLWPSQNH